MTTRSTARSSRTPHLFSQFALIAAVVLNSSLAWAASPIPAIPTDGTISSEQIVSAIAAVEAREGLDDETRARVILKIVLQGFLRICTDVNDGAINDLFECRHGRSIFFMVFKLVTRTLLSAAYAALDWRRPFFESFPERPGSINACASAFPSCTSSGHPTGAHITRRIVMYWSSRSKL